LQNPNVTAFFSKILSYVRLIFYILFIIYFDGFDASLDGTGPLPICGTPSDMARPATVTPVTGMDETTASPPARH
jgi:hypothetical protein